MFPMSDASCLAKTASRLHHFEKVYFELLKGHKSLMCKVKFPRVVREWLMVKENDLAFKNNK